MVDIEGIKTYQKLREWVKTNSIDLSEIAEATKHPTEFLRNTTSDLPLGLRNSFHDFARTYMAKKVSGCPAPQAPKRAPLPNSDATAGPVQRAGEVSTDKNGVLDGQVVDETTTPDLHCAEAASMSREPEPKHGELDGGSSSHKVTRDEAVELGRLLERAPLQAQLDEPSAADQPAPIGQVGQAAISSNSWHNASGDSDEEFDLEAAACQLTGLMSGLVRNNLQVGRILLRAKTVLGHGQFGKFVRSVSNLSTRFAQNAMKVADMVGDRKCADSAHLPWEVLSELARAKIPETTREELLGTLLGPNPPTLKDFKQLLKEACKVDPDPAHEEELETLTRSLVERLFGAFGADAPEVVLNLQKIGNKKVLVRMLATSAPHSSAARSPVAAVLS